jgi:hypothetical protein
MEKLNRVKTYMLSPFNIFFCRYLLNFNIVHFFLYVAAATTMTASSSAPGLPGAVHLHQRGKQAMGCISASPLARYSPSGSGGLASVAIRCYFFLLYFITHVYSRFFLWGFILVTPQSCSVPIFPSWSTPPHYFLFESLLIWKQSHTIFVPHVMTPLESLPGRQLSKPCAMRYLNVCNVMCSPVVSFSVCFSMVVFTF